MNAWKYKNNVNMHEVCLSRLRICVYMCMFICIYESVCMYVRNCVFIHENTFMSVHVCIYVHIYVYVCVHNHIFVKRRMSMQLYSPCTSSSKYGSMSTYKYVHV